MNVLTNLSIKKKLIAIILVSTLTTLTIGFVLIIVLNINALRRDMVDNTLVVARVVGDYAASALNFHYQAEAAEILRKLEGLEGFDKAILYDKEHQLFAVYQRSLPTAVPQERIPNILDTAHIPVSSYVFEDGYLHVYHRIVENNEYSGTLHLTATTSFLQAKIRNYVLTMAATGGGLIALALVLALQLQRVISRPILDLAKIVRKISQDNDYSVRFERRANDEIGVLTDGFNTMISQVQKREAERDKAQDALARALREDFRETVRNLQNLIYKVSRRSDGQYIFTLFEGKLSVNINSEMIIHKTLAEAFGKRHAERFTSLFDRAFLGEAVQFEMMFRRHYYLNALEPIIDNGTVREVVGSAVDITQLKRIENRLRLSEQRYKALVEGVPVGILQSVKRGYETPEIRLEFVNSEFVRQTGLSMQTFAEMMRSDHPALPFYAEDKAEAERVWREWLAGSAAPTLYRTYRLQITPTTCRWFDDYATKFSTEAGETIIIQALLDVTEKKQSEERLQQALRKERELNALKSRFVSTVSHEFRTPLTGILLSVDILNRYITKLSDKQRNDELDKIRYRVSEITNLMNDFLAQSESESIAGKFKPVEVDIAALCKTVVQEMESVSQAAHHGSIEQRFAVETAVMFGDTKLLTHVLRNLISNAIKYSTDEHSLVRISLDVRDEDVCIEVTDNGIGIPADELPNLFTPFFRASNVSKISGTGMGLSIVKEFVELHKGSIRVHSIVGIGSTFTVCFPLAQTERGKQVVEAAQTMIEEETSRLLHDRPSHHERESKALLM
jgi:signal transduction histidine kinase/HAMP domain-containing protein